MTMLAYWQCEFAPASADSTRRYELTRAIQYLCWPPQLGEPEAGERIWLPDGPGGMLTVIVSARYEGSARAQAVLALEARLSDTAAHIASGG